MVAEARTWLLTPWHHQARIKGVGVDCAQFLIGVYSACGIVPDIEAGTYPPDWHLHRDDPRFLRHVLAHADPVAAAMPGDVAMFRYGRHAAHGAIVLDEDGLFIHAWRDVGCVIYSDMNHAALSERFAGYYRPKGLE